MIQLLTFDLDNTLWAVDEVILRATRIKFDWLAEHYPELTRKISPQGFIDIRNKLIAQNPNIIADLSGLRILTIEHAALEAGFSNNIAKEIGKKSFDIFIEERNKVELFPHAKQILETLAKDYTLIAITNGNANLKTIGLEHFFAGHIKPIDTGKPKPAPEMFQLALKNSGVRAEHSIHIGDDFVCDIEGANKVGMKSIWVNVLQKQQPEADALADASIRHLADLPAAVKQLSER